MISNSGHDERGQYSGGEAGDQGGEWVRRSWYNRPWTVILRHPDPSVRGLIAQLAGEAADNDHVGYDQNERGLFWYRLKQAGYFPSAIRIKCESDCSAGVAAIVKATGYILGLAALQNVSADMYTGNEYAQLTSAGFEALRDAKYLSSPDHLLAGDILLSEHHHTAINLDYGDKVTMPIITVEKHIAATAAFFKEAQAGGYKYGDSHAIPPCADHVTSCDRGAVARPLWDLGLHDQPAGGVTVMNLEPWLIAHGWHKVTDPNALQRGDVVLMKQNGTTTPTAAWHTFLLTDFQKQTNVSKYDFGNASRWAAGQVQPFTHVKLNEWADKSFYCAFRLGSASPSGYTFTPSAVKMGSNSNSAYLATEILKARGYQGVKDSKGVLQDLELNFKWSKGDLAAMTRYKWDRIINGKNLSTGNGAGEINSRDWVDMLGGGLPFTALILPDKQRKGTSVLLCQEILRARGIKGADGKPLSLDGEWGENTVHAVRQYQKARKLKVTGKVTVDVWRDMIGIA